MIGSVQIGTLGHGRIPPTTHDPLYVSVIKAGLYAIGITLYLQPLSSAFGIAAAVTMACAAMALAALAHRRQLRVLVALAAGPLLLLTGGLLGSRLLDSSALARMLGIDGAFIASDILTFGLAALCTVFLLRMLAYRSRALSLLEVLFVAGSVAFTLASHRHRMLNRPRFLSDWAWSLGIDPTTVLLAIGAVSTLLAVLLFLRRQPALKLLTTLALMVLLGLLFHLVTDKRIESERAADALGLSGKSDPKPNQGKGGAGKDGPFKDDYSSKGPPQPVAIAILRDDYEPENGLLYFRQRALSKYNGHHLVATEDIDNDVIVRLPGGNQPVVAKLRQNPTHHLELPTTMYLLVDHPQPPALTHAASVTLVDNPNPQQFVAAYEVRSLVPAVPPKRLLGRRSIPGDWDERRRRHYTALPDDPRYRALADIIVREMDPRFSHDDVAKAFAIKRYLEKQGFYTRRTKHSDQADPTASFLFGSLRGYCVHFAHAAAYLFRSQGIAARVALGYAVQTFKRSGGSSILIMGDRAHAWPEIYLDGIGWVTFDVYPERTDMPPPQPVDYDLEKLLGELARDDPTGGLDPEGKALVIPWGQIGQGGTLLLATLMLLCYLVKGYRRVAPAFRRGRAQCRAAYLATLDRLSDLGSPRRPGETRERHAARLRSTVPALTPLTDAHLAQAFGSARAVDAGQFGRLVGAVRDDLRRNVHPAKRLLALLNPLGWLLTR